MANDFLPFCPTDTGTNLESLANYAVDTNRTSGNKPGIASSNLNNRALRQANAITANIAQLIANLTAADVLDDGNSARLLAQITSALAPVAPITTKYTSSSGNHNKTYLFAIASGNATIGATYTNNAVTFTVAKTIAAGLVLQATGAGDPAVSGTLTKTGGSGDATLTFYAVRSAIAMRIEMVGGGGGGAGGTGNGGSPGTGGTGGNTTFGTTLLVANGGVGGSAATGLGGLGGTASLGTGPVGIAVSGGSGNSGASQTSNTVNAYASGTGAASPFGGAGGGALVSNAGRDGATNSGSGGGGGGQNPNGTTQGGAGGGAGGYVNAVITSPAAQYAYAIGAAGTAGAAGTLGGAGGAGGSGVIIVTELFQ